MTTEPNLPDRDAAIPGDADRAAADPAGTPVRPSFFQTWFAPLDRFCDWGKSHRFAFFSGLCSIIAIPISLLLWLYPPPSATKPPAGPAGRSVQITEIKLLDAKPGPYPHEEELLYRFVIHGKDTFSVDRSKYALIMFYKPPGKQDQRYGWFAVSRLDNDGFAVPNWTRLDELQADHWEYQTSRIYLPRDASPDFIFRAVILPNDFVQRYGREIVQDKLGWGRESISEFVDLPKAIASEQRLFNGTPEKPDHHEGP